MRFGNFESPLQKPLGEGDDRKTFVDPANAERVISVTKEGAEKDTYLQMKGRFYLTKIVQALLPENIPKIYQIGETREGTQMVDRERIAHTPGHAALQEARQEGGSEEDEELAAKQMVKEMGKGMHNLNVELADVGIEIDRGEANVGNYTKNETGNVHYLESFKPWEVNPVKHGEVKVLFDEEALRTAVDGIPDQEVKNECTKHLGRLTELLAEERIEQQKLYEEYKASLMECGPLVEEIEAIMGSFLKEETLLALHAIKTEEEAGNSEERKSARNALILIRNKLTPLKDETNITSEKNDELYRKLKILDQAVGMGNRGIIDHTR